MKTRKQTTTITELFNYSYSLFEKPIGCKKRRTLQEIISIEEVQKTFNQIRAWFEKTGYDIDLEDDLKVFSLTIVFKCEENESLLRLENLNEYLYLTSNLEILNLGDAINYFEKEGILLPLKSFRSNKKASSMLANYYMEPQFLTAIVRNKLRELSHENGKMSENQLIRRTVLLFNKMDLESSLDYKEGLINFIKLVHNNKHLELVQKLIDLFGEADFKDVQEEFKITPSLNMFITLITISYALSEECPFDFIQKFEDAVGTHLTLELVNALENEEHPLIKKNLISVAPQMLREHMSIYVEDKQLLQYFLPKLSLNIEFDRLRFIKLLPPTENQEPFHYPDDLQNELQFISELIAHPDLDRLTIFISGAPGVGKTSFVRQLCKDGRHLFTSLQVKSKWFGESQRQLTLMFKEFRKMKDKIGMAKKPILFIDEADGLLSSRKESDETIAETTNELQTILLQQIQEFKGILVCCSNFDINRFDPAFERRFDIIIHMKSDEKARFEMLKQRSQSHSIKISDDDMLSLSKHENLSPAIIDLILRRAKLKQLVGREDFNFVKELESRIIGNRTNSFKNVTGFKTTSN
jgi:GTPase SAR1 family protein